MADMLKTVMLTVPMFSESHPDDPILVSSEDLQIEVAKPGYLYGLQGLLKGQFLSSFASKAGKERRTYRLIDLMLKVPVDPDQKFVGGQHLDELTMLSAKSMRSDVAVGVGEMWLQLAQEIGNKKLVLSSGIDWSKPLDYMLAYPQVATALFESGLLPKLRLIIMPMMTKLQRDPTWIGIVPLSIAPATVKAGEVKLHSAQVRLPAEAMGATGGYFSLPAPPPFGGG